MIKFVNVVRCECESCHIVVGEFDNFCRSCGQELKENITYQAPSTKDIIRELVKN